MVKAKRVLIMAGGTGGHVFPGLSVAKCLRENGFDVHWMGTEKGLEAKIATANQFPLHLIHIQGVRGKGLKNLLLAPWRLTKAILEAMQIIRSLNPDVVIGMGGFVSGPGGIASFILHKKLIIHEQNARAGLTNRFLATFATKVLEGFPNTFKFRRNVMTIGNPVRREIAAIAAPIERFKERTAPVRLLVFGGSLGADAINQLLPQALAKLPAEVRPSVRHQAGEANYPRTAKSYEEHGIAAEVVPFIHEMDKAYAWADMVLCRAGALTVAELCAAGLGAILIPYPYAVDDHQTANANFMANKKAAILAKQSTLNADILAVMLKELCISAERRQAMAVAAYQLRTVNAADQILNICKEICH